MSKFDFAVSYVLSNEGSTFSNDPNDAGGATKYGITLRTAQAYPLAHIDTADDVKNMTLADAKTIYYALFWKFEAIRDWRVAAKMMDVYVNMPPGNAVRIFQRAANACGKEIAVDGLFGLQTEDTINSLNSCDFLEELIDQLHFYYGKVVDKNPKQIVWLRGWLARADRLPPTPPQEDTNGQVDNSST